MRADWNYPTAIRAGRGRIAELPAACREFGMRAPLLVTDPGLAQLPMIAEALAACERAGLAAAVFSDIKPNPTGENIYAGAEAFRNGRHDGVIAFGGGSGLDAGKAVAVIARQKCTLWDLEDIGDNWLRADPARIAPLVAAPTTAGTGSEVGRAALIVNEDERRKVIIFHPKMLPGCVILDPELSAGLPPLLTAATGMDALSHNLEAYCSPLFHPMAEGIALEGMRLIKQHLPDAVENGADLNARAHMLVASSMGAAAFQRGLGAMHALAHPLGALYDAHHRYSECGADAVCAVRKPRGDRGAHRASRAAFGIGAEFRRVFALGAGIARAHRHSGGLGANQYRRGRRRAAPERTRRDGGRRRVGGDQSGGV